jgi:hypothetical protein
MLWSWEVPLSLATASVEVLAHGGVTPTCVPHGYVYGAGSARRCVHGTLCLCVQLCVGRNQCFHARVCVQVLRAYAGMHEAVCRCCVSAGVHEAICRCAPESHACALKC